jgi:hypothetical protein
VDIARIGLGVLSLRANFLLCLAFVGRGSTANASQLTKARLRVVGRATTDDRSRRAQFPL